MMTAAVEGAVRRLRPVLMTALIVGGLVSATLLTLLLLPILFPYFSDEKQP